MKKKNFLDVSLAAIFFQLVVNWGIAQVDADASWKLQSNDGM